MKSAMAQNEGGKALEEILINRLAHLSLAALIVIGSAPLSGASPAIIGIASARTGVTLDDSKVTGTATVFEGSRITADGYARLHLNNGMRLDLDAGSRVQVFEDHEALQSGASEVQGSAGFEIDAQNVRVKLASDKAAVRVRIGPGDARVYVTALNAPVDVLNNQGLFVAKVLPGMPLSFFRPQGAEASSFEGTGCVLQKNNAAILTNDDGSEVTELRGYDLRKAIGKHSHIIGTLDPAATPVAGASKVVKVTKAVYVQKAKGSDCSSVATKVGASTAAVGLAAAVGTGAAAAGAGVATAGVVVGVASAAVISTTVAVVAGVAVAGAVGLGTLVATGTTSTPSP